MLHIVLIFQQLTVTISQRDFNAATINNNRIWCRCSFSSQLATLRFWIHKDCRRSSLESGNSHFAFFLVYVPGLWTHPPLSVPRSHVALFLIVSNNLCIRRSLPWAWPVTPASIQRPSTIALPHLKAMERGVIKVTTLCLRWTAYFAGRRHFVISSGDREAHCVYRILTLRLRRQILSRMARRVSETGFSPSEIQDIY